MVQWITVVLALLGFAYNGYKDYTSGNLQPLTNETQGVEYKKPIQYCLMAYDPNVNKVFYQHEDGKWYDYAPQIRQYQDQGQKALGTSNGTQGTQVYPYGQSPQASAYSSRY